MDTIINDIKYIAKEIKKLIETSDGEYANTSNSTGDNQLKLDIESDNIISNIFHKNPNIKQIISEEKDEVEDINEQGEFLIAYDPLDGSSLVDVNLSVGSIFGIYKDSFSAKNLVASCYIVYGPRLELVIAKESVKLYRLINNKFVFIRDLKLNKKGKLNAPGGTQKNWFNYHREMVQELFKRGYRLRYSGAMVADLHQILLKGGGLFSYPKTTDKEKGKLRQLFEVFPFAYVYKLAGGMAVDGKKDIFEVKTSSLHDTTPCFFGSCEEIEFVLETYKDK